MKSAWILCVALCAWSVQARAEVREQGAEHFLIEIPARVIATPVRLYAAIAAVDRWWSPEHTWSGKSANLSLKASAGGCFCERWATGSAEHGRVIMARENELLRLESALGPLQSLPVKGVLEFELTAADPETTLLKLSYRVSGSSTSALDQWAAPVDQVLGGQMDRLLRFVDTGDADSVDQDPVEDTQAPTSKRAARAEVFAEWARQAQQQAQAAKSAKDKQPSKPEP